MRLAREQAKGKPAFQRKKLAAEAVINELEGRTDVILAEWVMKRYEHELRMRGVGLLTLKEWLDTAQPIDAGGD